MMKKALTISNVTIGYRNGKRTISVVDEINASLHGCELVALIGKNGAGKSTLLRTLSAFQKPLSGTIECDGKNMTEMQVSDVAKELAVVLTANESAPLTVRELVTLGRTPYTNFLGRTTEKDDRIVEYAMDTMAVRQFENRLVTTLSDGERQKCMIAKALAQQTPVIMLDEPTAYLDYPSKVRLMRTLRQLAANECKGIIVSTHDVEIALRLADKIWLMDGGRLVAGTVDELSQCGALNAFIDDEGVAYDKNEKRIEFK